MTVVRVAVAIWLVALTEVALALNCTPESASAPESQPESASVLESKLESALVPEVQPDSASAPEGQPKSVSATENKPESASAPESQLESIPVPVNQPEHPITPKSTSGSAPTTASTSGYFAIVVFKFLILMIEECGGDEVFLKSSINKTFRISTGPCCCCCPCLPQVPITRRSLFMLKLGSFQFALLKVVFTILSIALWRNGNFDVADMKISGAAIWINPGVGVLTIIALWPVAIMFIHVRNTLRSLNIVPKYAMYQLVLVLSQLQTAIINILAMSGTIGCSPPYSSQSRGYLMSQQLLILEMFIITLVTRLLYRRKYDPIPYSDSEVERNIASTTESSKHCSKI